MIKFDHKKPKYKDSRNMPDFGVYDSEDAATAQAGLFRSTVAWQLDPDCTVAGCSAERQHDWE